MSAPGPNVAASVRARLLNRAKAENTDYNQLLVRYAIERLLYRLSASAHRESFVLKGAMLFAVWEGSPHRPTRDVDFLGFGDRSVSRLVEVFQSLCDVNVEEDGLTFDPASVRADDIRTTDDYGGVRVTLTASMGGAVLRLQADVGFGDAVTPAAPEALYPRLLKEFPQPNLRIYPRETVVAEKLEAIAKLGMLNTRVKDYYDLHHLCETFEFEGASLVAAITATFDRRGTPLPEGLPVGLTPAFSQDRAKQTQWAAFRRRTGEQRTPESLADVTAAISSFLEQPLSAARGTGSFLKRWTPPGPWAD
jgi:predicted nucleotidyltransferase component of viral defense system